MRARASDERGRKRATAAPSEERGDASQRVFEVLAKSGYLGASQTSLDWHSVRALCSPRVLVTARQPPQLVASLLARSPSALVLHGSFEAPAVTIPATVAEVRHGLTASASEGFAAFKDPALEHLAGRAEEVTEGRMPAIPDTVRRVVGWTKACASARRLAHLRHDQIPASFGLAASTLVSLEIACTSLSRVFSPLGTLASLRRLVITGAYLRWGGEEVFTCPPRVEHLELSGVMTDNALVIRPPPSTRTFIAHVDMLVLDEPLPEGLLRLDIGGAWSTIQDLRPWPPRIERIRIRAGEYSHPVDPLPDSVTHFDIRDHGRWERSSNPLPPNIKVFKAMACDVECCVDRIKIPSTLEVLAAPFISCDAMASLPHLKELELATVTGIGDATPPLPRAATRLLLGNVHLCRLPEKFADTLVELSLNHDHLGLCGDSPMPCELPPSLERLTVGYELLVQCQRVRGRLPVLPDCLRALTVWFPEEEEGGGGGCGADLGRWTMPDSLLILCFCCGRDCRRPMYRNGALPALPEGIRIVQLHEHFATPYRPPPRFMRAWQPWGVVTAQVLCHKECIADIRWRSTDRDDYNPMACLW